MPSALPFAAEAPREGVAEFPLETPQGAIGVRLHATPDGDAAVLWVFGSGGGLGGPAGGVYSRLSEALRPRGVAGLELAYRRPGRLDPCIEDVLTGLAFLKDLGRRRVVLVGHSFGGAVVIAVGLASPDVAAVAALSGPAWGADEVGRLAPRPVLLVHGEADEILPADCSRDLFARAGEPKRLILYPGCSHGLDECREALDRDLEAWLSEVLGV